MTLKLTPRDVADGFTAEDRAEATARLQALLDEAERRPLSGWDVDYDGRIVTLPPWDFDAMVDAQARDSDDLLDLGTGGGEWLSRLPHRPIRTVATEGWAPSIPVARARLQPLGVPLVAVDGAPDNTDQTDHTDRADGAADGALPFADASFQLVTNRHESYVPREIARILEPGGRFLTQQVASGAADDLYRLFKKRPPAVTQPWTLDVAVKQLTDAGLIVDIGAKGDERLRFADVGALVWYVTRLPWVMPGFSVAEARQRLEQLHNRITLRGPLSVRQPLFVLSARKPV